MSSKTRLEVKYENKSEKFILKSQLYSKQFAHLYAYRLQEGSKLLEKKIASKWGSKYPIRKLFELREENTEKCVIIGTLFKHQVFKPSILREISEENQLAPQPPRQHYGDVNDKLILEDELQRVKLEGNVDLHNVTTGIVCAVLGNIEADGKFEVDECIFYESGPQKTISSLVKSPLLVLVSGLDQISSADYSMSLDVFQHWLSGNINPVGQSDDASLVRLIVAGNSVRSAVEFKPTAQLSNRKPESPSTVLAMKELDRWFASWSQTIHLDVMPGEFDPSNFMLPQQAFHRCMFPLASRYSSFRGVTNPYAFALSDRSIVGTSGQNIHNILKTTNITDPLQALRCTLKWSHIAPTCPDTLPCYPYVKEDPFIIYECPNVYFAGNMDKFQTELYTGSDGQKTRLICVPSFAKTQTAVVVDLNTLDCRSVSFKVSL